MDYSTVGPKTLVLKVNLHCSACERKVHKLLKKVNGVSSIGIDGESGRVTVIGNVEPYTLIMALAKVGKKAELIWQHNPNPNPNHKETQGPQNPSPAQAGVEPHLNAAQIAQLHQLSQFKSLKQVELTHSNSIKMKFKSNGSNDPAQKNETQTTKKITVDDNVGRGAAGPGPGPAANAHYGTNVNAHHQHQYQHQHQHHCCHEVGGPSRTSGVPHEYFNGCGPPPPACRGVPPVVPPPPTYSLRAAGPPQEAVPPVAYPYPNLFSDDKPGGCKLM